LAAQLLILQVQLIDMMTCENQLVVIISSTIYQVWRNGQVTELL